MINQEYEKNYFKNSKIAYEYNKKLYLLYLALNEWKKVNQNFKN